MLTLLLFGFSFYGSGQEINFGQYADYTLTVGELNSGRSLDFGQVISGGGTYSVDITNAKTITITGVKYLDVIVDVSAPISLFLNGNPGSSQTIPFTLQAAYANNSGTPTVGNAKFITDMSNNSFIKRIPILERQSGQPPGPPPPPPTNAFDQSQVEETMHLYFYGSITVGQVDAGNYSTQITITINYD